MKQIRTSLKKHRNLLIFISIIFIFGIFTGLLFYFKQDESVREILITNLDNPFSGNVFSFQNIFYHFIFSLILIILSFIFLSVPLIILLFFFEGISLGFLIAIFTSIYKLKMFYFFIIYFLLIKALYLFFLLFLFINIISFSKNYFNYLKNKKNDFLKDLKRIIFLLLSLIINDLVIYFCFNKLLIFLLG